MDVQYIFRRLDNDALIEVDFETMMSADMGVITLPDGVQARRSHGHNEAEWRTAEPVVACSTDHDVSLSLGFPDSQLRDMEADRIRSGFVGVEFYRDKQVPGMVGIRCSSEAEKERYIRHRGYYNQSSRNGGKMGKEVLEMAKQAVIAKYGDYHGPQEAGPQGGTQAGQGCSQ